MTPKQADLIRRSFDAIWPVRRKIASRFYCSFFELAPDAQRLFPSDMGHDLWLMPADTSATCGPMTSGYDRPSCSSRRHAKHVVLSRALV